MHKILYFAFFLLFVQSVFAQGTSVVSSDNDKVWNEMPAGARPVYIGIHGGTVPVSLLTAGDGSPMIAQVGLTGTDFLNFMRDGVPPSLVYQKQHISEETQKKVISIPILPRNGAKLLLAGQGGDDIPVIYATGRAFERLSLVPTNWAPFGLTEKPLSLEGEVKILNEPKKFPRSKRTRMRR